MTTLAELKALRLEPDQQHNLGPDEELLLRIKKVNNWFGSGKDNAGLTLEDNSGEWMQAAVFGAPSEIAKMEGEWIPIRPAAGSKSGVWVQGREYTPSKGAKAGQTIRKNELKIMSGCFRWDQATTDPPGPPQPSSAPTPAPAGNGQAKAGGYQAMTDREWVVWASGLSGDLHEMYETMLRDDPKDPALQQAVVEAVQATLVHLSIRHEKGSLRLTYGQAQAKEEAGPEEDPDASIPF